MKPQSLSILVPGGCPNNCACCCSKLHDSPYENLSRILNADHTDEAEKFVKRYRQDYYDAMKFAKDNDCHDLIFTGENGECLVNKKFMEEVIEMNQKLPNPFIKCELQTSGCFLLNNDEENLIWLRDKIRIKLISLSLFDIFNSDNNSLYSRPKTKKAFVNIEETCKSIKKHGMSLRLSINMTNLYQKNGISPKGIFEKASLLGANQITFRILYFVENPQTPEEHEINDWIINNKCLDEYTESIKDYIRENGKPLERLSFGAIRYSVNGISVVIDDNCMSVTDVNDIKEDVKYLILRPNCKLYTRWNDPASLLF